MKARLFVGVLTLVACGCGQEGPTPQLQAVAFADGQFVAVGSLVHTADLNTSSVIVTSADGTKWTRRDPSALGTLWSVANGSGKFVVVGGDIHDSGLETSVVLISSDAITWTPAVAPPTEALEAVVFTGDRFVALSIDGTAFSSVDGGDHWQGSPTHLMYAKSIAFGNGAFVATGETSSATSADGVTWTPIQPTLAWVLFQNDEFVAAPAGAECPDGGCGDSGSQLIRSSDGTNWQSAVSVSDTPTSIGTFSGAELVTTTRGKILRSTNHTSWQTIDVGIERPLNSVASGSGRVVAVGAVDTIFSSSDGKEWQPLVVP